MCLLFAFGNQMFYVNFLPPEQKPLLICIVGQKIHFLPHSYMTHISCLRQLLFEIEMQTPLQRLILYLQISSDKYCLRFPKVVMLGKGSERIPPEI